MEQCLINVGVLSARCCGPKGVLCAISDLSAEPSLCKRSTKMLAHVLRLTEIQNGICSVESTVMRWLCSQVQYHCQTHYDGGWLVAYLLSDVSLKLRRISHVSEALVVHSLERIVSWLKVLFSVKYRGLCGARKVTMKELHIVAATMLYSIPSNSTGNMPSDFTSAVDSTYTCLRRKVAELIVDACVRTSVNGFMYPQRIHVHVYTHMAALGDTREYGDIAGDTHDSFNSQLQPSLVNGILLERTFFSSAMRDLILHRIGYPSKVLLLSFSVTDDIGDWELILNALHQCRQLNYESSPTRHEDDVLNRHNYSESRASSNSCRGVILASQKVIDPSFQQLLLRLEIGVIERLSINCIDAFKLATGATLFDDLTAFNTGVICSNTAGGFDPSVHTGVIQGISSVSDRCMSASLLIVGSVSSGGGQISTLLIPSLSTLSSCSVQAEEIKMCIHATCRLFASLYVMPGGGVFERFVAHFIGQMGERTKTDYCLRAVADVVRNSLLQYSDQILGVGESCDITDEEDIFSTFDATSIYMSLLQPISPHPARHIYQAVREIEGIVQSVGYDRVKPLSSFPVLSCGLESCPLSIKKTSSPLLLDIFEVRSEGIISALEAAALFGSVGQFKSYE